VKKNSVLNFDLRQLRSFIEAVREASITRASRKLGLGQATISHHILQLEASLGVQLIQRNSKNFALTEEGTAFLSFCDDIFSRLERLRGEIGSGGFSAPTIVAASTIPSAYILPGAVADIRFSNQEYSFRTIISNSRESIELIKEGRADIGIVGRSTRHPSLEFHRCSSDEIVLVGLPSMPDSITPGALKSMPLVVRENGSGTRTAYEKKLSGRGVLPRDLRVAFECSTSEAIKEAVASGIGVGFISDLAIKNEVSLGIMKIIRITGVSIKRDFFIVYHKKRRLSDAARELIKVLKK